MLLNVRYDLVFRFGRVATVTGLLQSVIDVCTVRLKAGRDVDRLAKETTAAWR